MKQVMQCMIILLVSLNASGLTCYTGTIDKYPVEFTIDASSDGKVSGIYAYSKYDEPIAIDGVLSKNKLMFFKRDTAGKNNAALIFDNFDRNNKKLSGLWTDSVSGKQYTINLTKSEGTDMEILQKVSLRNHYFKLIVSKNDNSYGMKVIGVKVIEKKTDRLIQKINVECQLWGFENISAGDYNFDGIEDFSVFESSAAGPNTSSLYFLYNPRTNRYFDSGFSGTSLEFDSQTKRIYEHNQCCAGSSHMNAEYKVVNNKMVLIKQTCTEYDEKIDDFKTVKCE